MVRKTGIKRIIFMVSCCYHLMQPVIVTVIVTKNPIHCYHFFRLRQELHTRLQSSGIRTQLENQVRQLIQQGGGVNQVDVETMSKQLRGAVLFTTL